VCACVRMSVCVRGYARLRRLSQPTVAESIALADADQWNNQATIQRLNESLIARGYLTWFDVTNMKGSTMDAMSDAIEGADVMLYGVSLAYKESANVRFASQGMFH
jgi:hypothetical protein